MTQATSFADRKAARKAAGNQQFAFQVVAGYYFGGEVVGQFNSRKEAEAFAFEQIGSLVGNTKAFRALSARHPEDSIPMGQTWEISRVVRA